MKDLLNKFYESSFNISNIRVLFIISFITAILSEKITTVLLVNFIYIIFCFFIFIKENEEIEENCDNVYEDGDDVYEDGDDSECNYMIDELYDIDALSKVTDVTLMLESKFIEEIVKDINIQLDINKTLCINYLVRNIPEIKRFDEKFFELNYELNYKILDIRKLKLDSL